MHHCADARGYDNDPSESPIMPNPMLDTEEVPSIDCGLMTLKVGRQLADHLKF